MSDKTVSEKLLKKRNAKELLRNKYGLSLNKKKLLLSIFVDESQSPEDILNFLDNFLEAVKAISISVLLVAPKSIASELNKFRSPRGVSVLCVGHNTHGTILEASDVSFIFPLSQMKAQDVKQMWAHGVVPITSEKKFQSENYDPNRETGRNFFIPKGDVWNVFAALVRASETYRFPYDWRHIVRQALKA